MRESFESFLNRVHTSILQNLKEGPLFSKINISPVDLCNRVCSFCPRGHDYPNSDVHISNELINKIGVDLEELEYKGSVEICGNGEPLLSKNLIPLIIRLQDFILSITTNGDRLTEKKISELDEHGIDYFVVSLYDGEYQIRAFKKKFESCGINLDRVDLREYWNIPTTFANRAGYLFPEFNKRKTPCYYLHYNISLEVDGNIAFCCQSDYLKKYRLGYLLNTSLKEVWYGKKMNYYRRLLEKGRDHSPCSTCSVGGIKYGKEFVDQWKVNRAI